MPQSTVTSKGQTTIPGAVREALKIRAGDRLEFRVEGDHAIVRVHPGTLALGGSLPSQKGRGLSFKQVRARAAAVARREWERRKGGD